MEKHTVVYESPNKADFSQIVRHLTKQIPVWVIEPFWANHHTRGLTGFPQHLPESVQGLIQEGKVSLLESGRINGKEIALLSAEMAVDSVEAVYPVYRKKHDKIIDCVLGVLKFPVAENVFKTELCVRLAEFYSLNMMLHRIEEFLYPLSVVVYPDMNVSIYLSVEKLLSRSQQKFFENGRVRFPARAYIRSWSEAGKKKFISTAKLIAQTAAAGLIRSATKPPQAKKTYPYGVTVVSSRQLRKNQRRYDFLVDNARIVSEDVVYFPLMPLSDAQTKEFHESSSNVIHLPQAGKSFSNFREWKTLLLAVFRQNVFAGNDDEIKAAVSTLFHYFRWRKVLESVNIKNFITHADFGRSHIGRNIALNQSGVQTWYFTDSAHHNFIFQEEGKGDLREPLWTFLHYDRFVTWNRNIEEYYGKHPGSSFRRTDVVGCIWSAHIKNKAEARRETSLVPHEVCDGFFVLACFDSTYLRNVHCSYEEGIAFGLHILQFVNEHPDIYVVFKEKKDRSIHSVLDQKMGPRLMEVYDQMSAHPRITFCSNQEDSSEIIAISDATISFAFTSTTFEALSANRPAIWHDPLGYYRTTLYGGIDGVTTRSYEELKRRIEEIREMKPDEIRNPLPEGSPLLDPFRDGKAIDRFRELLASSR